MSQRLRIIPGTLIVIIITITIIVITIILISNGGYWGWGPRTVGWWGPSTHEERSVISGTGGQPSPEPCAGHGGGSVHISKNPPWPSAKGVQISNSAVEPKHCQMSPSLLLLKTFIHCLALSLMSQLQNAELGQNPSGNWASWWLSGTASKIPQVTQGRWKKYEDVFLLKSPGF